MSVSSATGKRQDDSASAERNESPVGEALESSIMKEYKKTGSSERETSKFKQLFCCCVPALVSANLGRTCVYTCMQR